MYRLVVILLFVFVSLSASTQTEDFTFLLKQGEIKNDSGYYGVALKYFDKAQEFRNKGQTLMLQRLILMPRLQKHEIL